MGRSSAPTTFRPLDNGLPPEATVDPDPIDIDSLGLDSRLREGVRDMGFKQTRPIQSAVIPIALAGHDLIACAETGTGKTAAFLLPILQRMLAAIPADETPEQHVPRTRVLVIAPTRELAVQIEDDIHGLAYHTPITSVAVYGGVEMGMQDRALNAGVDLIVATPGRLMDHMRQGNVKFEQLEVLVLDEADRMMDMGFWPDVRRIISALPTTRQTLLFSATMPEEVVRQAAEIVREPKYVQIGSRSAPARTITHEAHTVPLGEKVDWLVSFLKRTVEPVLIFVRTKRGADKVAQQLVGRGVRAAALHADRTQDERRRAVERFRGGDCPVLVATDIAARGLDIDAIGFVVNFEVPDSTETYVHRVGRTGRSGTSGTAITLVAPEEARAFASLEKSLGICLQ